MLEPDQATRKVLDHLKARVREHYGSIAQFEVAVLGKYRGYLSRIYSQTKDATLKELHRILGRMGLDIVSFWGAAFSSAPDPVAMLRGLEISGAAEKLRPELTRLLEISGRIKFDTSKEVDLPADEIGLLLEELIAHPPLRQLELLEHRPGYGHAGLLEKYLRYLDDLRYRNPREAAKLVVAACSLLPAAGARAFDDLCGCYCRALGIYASSHQQLGRLRTANRALRGALICAERWHLPRYEPELLQRTCYLLRDYGELERALEISTRASRIYGELHEPAGCARMLVIRDIMLRRLDRPQEAVQAFEGALGVLPASDSRFLAAAHLGLGKAQLQLGNMAATERALLEVEALVDPAEGFNRANLLLARADLAFARRRFPEAAELYRRVWRLVEGLSPYDAALAALDVIKVALALGRPEEAKKVASSMIPLLSAVSGNKVAEAAVYELIRAAGRNGIEESLLQRVRKLILELREDGKRARTL